MTKNSGMWGTVAFGVTLAVDLVFVLLIWMLTWIIRRRQD